MCDAYSGEEFSTSSSTLPLVVGVSGPGATLLAAIPTAGTLTATATAQRNSQKEETPFESTEFL